MIIDAVAGSLPMSVGVALSPIPIAAVLMTLMTARASTNAPAFLVGWIAGILTVGLVVFLLPVSQTEHGEPNQLSGWVRIGLGIAILYLAVRQWQRRPQQGEPVEVPKMLSQLDTFGGWHALLTGFLLIAVNVKCLVLVIAAATTIAAASESMKSRMIAFTTFTTIASSSIAVPIANYFLFRDKAEPMLERWKVWLIKNNANVLVVILLVFGEFLLGIGLEILVN